MKKIRQKTKKHQKRIEKVGVKEKTKIKPVVFGGGQQKGMRSGTDNVPGIAGLGVAAKKIYEDFDEKIEQLKEKLNQCMKENDNG